MYLFVLVASGAALYFASVAAKRPRPAVIVAIVLWLLYAVYEVLIARAVLCGEVCNIRVDVLLIWPLLWVASFFAIKAPGPWTARGKLAGAVGIGSLLAALLMLALVHLEDSGVFFPEARPARAAEAAPWRLVQPRFRKPPTVTFCMPTAGWLTVRAATMIAPWRT